MINRTLNRETPAWYVCQLTIDMRFKVSADPQPWRVRHHGGKLGCDLVADEGSPQRCTRSGAADSVASAHPTGTDHFLTG